MPSFNLARHLKKTAADIPNGTSVSTVPNGSGLGQGVMLSDGNPQGIPGESEKGSLKAIIGEMLSAVNRGAEDDEIANIAKKSANASIPDQFGGNDNLMKMIVALSRRAMEGQDIAATDPETGETENSLMDIASMIIEETGWDEAELIEEAERDEDDSLHQDPLPPAMANNRSAAEESKEEEEEETTEEKEEDDDDKKKGNPFKVLMGRVQKLLDHGIDGRNDVVRTISRQKGNKWKRDTIEKAYDIVKDRNVREERKRVNGEGAFNLARHFGIRKAQAPMSDTDERTEKRPSPYDMERSPGNMSFWELISRAQYLYGLSNASHILLNNNLPNRQDTDESQAAKDLKIIRDELERRGYSEEMVDSIFHIPPTKGDYDGYQGERVMPNQ